jgi:hypothetical protein
MSGLFAWQRLPVLNYGAKVLTFHKILSRNEFFFHFTQVKLFSRWFCSRAGSVLALFSATSLARQEYSHLLSEAVCFMEVQM